jgi:DNA polymerase
MTISLEQVKKQVIECTKCQLCETRTNAVPGAGSNNATIVFIGEAPGRSEDRVGIPFVGSAGKKLSLALEHAGISRQTIYITNVVKCRPPNNRVPNENEKKICKEYLDLELEIIKPKIICIMGNTAYQSILGGNDITKHRGKIIEKNGRKYFLTIHPAATIYNQELFPLLEKDMKNLARYVNKL